MVYVFGIEGVPLFEMLFIIMLLMVGALVFILLELKKLRDILSEETSDINRFEKDLAEFEQDEGPTKKVIDYIRLGRTKGISDVQIENTLVSQGWDRKDIDTIFKKI